MSDELKIDRAITGDLTRRERSRVPQEGPVEFLAAVDAILEIEGVESIRWEQYTPYFNDGEPCEFSADEFRVKVVGTDDEAGDYGDGYLTTYDLTDGVKDESLISKGLRWGTTEHAEATARYYAADNRIFNDFPGVDVPALYTALSEGWSRFENVMENNFGDHARVTATREGFNVEYYEHD